MVRYKKYQRKDTRTVISPESECNYEEEKEKINKRLTKEVIESDRKSFIKNILELHDILESHRKGKIDVIDVARGKNILQSLVYLILNDKFYSKILAIRKKLGLPKESFNGEGQYKKWAEKYTRKCSSNLDYKIKELRCEIDRKSGVKSYKNIIRSCGHSIVYKEAKYLVKENRLTLGKDISKLASILMYFITRRLKFEKFFQTTIPMVAEGKFEPLAISFDVDVKEDLDSRVDFCKCEWRVRLYPFTNLTGFEKLLKNFFIREIMHEKNKNSYDKQYMEIQLEELEISKKQRRDKSELSIVDGGNIIILKFLTNFFTKPSRIVKLYKEKYPAIKALMNQKTKAIQKKNLSENFERNLKVYKLRKRGLTYDEISGHMYDTGSDLGDNYVNSLKGELGEFKANVRNALKRKIVF